MKLLALLLMISCLPGCIVYNLWKANEQTRPRYESSTNRR